MKFKIIITAFMLMLAIPTAADFVTMSRAYEVALADLTVPPSQHSRLMFRQCADCDSESIRLTPQTRFIVNGRDVLFDKFRLFTRQATTAHVVTVTILHELESDTVESVFLTFE